VCGKESSARMNGCELKAALGAMRKLCFGGIPHRVKPLEKDLASLKQLEYIKGMWAVCARTAALLSPLPRKLITAFFALVPLPAVMILGFHTVLIMSSYNSYCNTLPAYSLRNAAGLFSQGDN
jgi:hypothetical protein